MYFIALFAYSSPIPIINFDINSPSPSPALDVVTDNAYGYCYLKFSDICSAIVEEHECNPPCWWVGPSSPLDTLE